MLTETLNDCVVLPHLANWAHPVRLRRSWATSIASGIDGSEDRAAGRTAPTRKLTYSVLADGIQERAILTERLKAALKSGRAVCPLFGRAQGCNPSGSDLEITWGRWPWAAGEYAFLCLPNKPQNRGINKRIRISCGTSDHLWEAETNYSVVGGDAGGATGDTANAIDIDHLGTIPPPTQIVLQHCRYVDASSGPAQGIRYRVSVTEAQRCKIRLWFAFWAASPDPDSVYRIVSAGNPTPIDIQPFEACDHTLNQAGYVDISVTPDANRVVDFTIYLLDGVWIQVNAVEVFSTCWQMAPIQEVQQLDAVTLTFAAEDILFPDFTEIPQIYPVLFGKPTAGDIESLTNRVGEVEISVEEPLGEPATRRTGTCQVEICGLPTVEPPGPEQVRQANPLVTSSIGDSGEQRVVWKWGTTHDYLTPGVYLPCDAEHAPPSFLADAQIQANYRWLEDAIAAFKAIPGNETAVFEPAVWEAVPGVETTPDWVYWGAALYNSNQYGESNPGVLTDWNGGYWILVAYYWI